MSNIDPDPTSWWHYFYKDKVAQKARCRSCLTFEKDRSKDKGTNGLKYHLEHHHPTLFSQKLEVERQKREKSSQNKQQQLQVIKRPRTEIDGECSSDLLTMENKTEDALKPFPIFGYF